MATYYWVGGDGTWSDYTNHWSDTSGGTAGVYSNPPTYSDDVIFDDNSFTGNTQRCEFDSDASTSYFQWNLSNGMYPGCGLMGAYNLDAGGFYITGTATDIIDLGGWNGSLVISSYTGNNYAFGFATMPSIYITSTKSYFNDGVLIRNNGELKIETSAYTEFGYGNNVGLGSGIFEPQDLIIDVTNGGSIYADCNTTWQTVKAKNARIWARGSGDLYINLGTSATGGMTYFGFEFGTDIGSIALIQDNPNCRIIQDGTWHKAIQGTFSGGTYFFNADGTKTGTSSIADFNHFWGFGTLSCSNIMITGVCAIGNVQNLTVTNIEYADEVLFTEWNPPVNQTFGSHVYYIGGSYTIYGTSNVFTLSNTTFSGNLYAWGTSPHYVDHTDLSGGTVTFKAGGTYELENFQEVLHSGGTNDWWISSATGTQYNFKPVGSMIGGTFSFDYMHLQDANAMYSNGGTISLWNLGVNVTDEGNNTGWGVQSEPTDVGALSIGQGTIGMNGTTYLTVSWGLGSYQTSYYLERSGTSWTLSSSATTQTDTGLWANTVYSYRLQARNNGGTKYSEWTSGTTLAIPDYSYDNLTTGDVINYNNVVGEVEDDTPKAILVNDPIPKVI